MADYRDAITRNEAEEEPLVRALADGILSERQAEGLRQQREAAETAYAAQLQKASAVYERIIRGERPDPTNPNDRQDVESWYNMFCAPRRNPNILNVTAMPQDRLRCHREVFETTGVLLPDILTGLLMDVATGAPQARIAAGAALHDALEKDHIAADTVPGAVKDILAQYHRAAGLGIPAAQAVALADQTALSVPNLDEDGLSPGTSRKKETQIAMAPAVLAAPVAAEVSTAVGAAAKVLLGAIGLGAIVATPGDTPQNGQASQNGGSKKNRKNDKKEIHSKDVDPSPQPEPPEGLNPPPDPSRKDDRRNKPGGRGKRPRDSSKNEPHGKDPEDIAKRESETRKKREEELNNAVKRRDKRKIKFKMQRDKRKFDKTRKGESHHRHSGKGKQ